MSSLQVKIKGGINRIGTVPTILRTPATMIQPTLDLKSFLQFPVEGPPAISLFPNFSHIRPRSLEPASTAGHFWMDPVQKAVISHTFGFPLIKTKRPVISCNVCQIRFNSENIQCDGVHHLQDRQYKQNQAEAHYKGNRHARRVKGIEASKTKQKDSATSTSEHSSSTETSLNCSPTEPYPPGQQQQMSPVSNGSSAAQQTISISCMLQRSTIAATTSVSMMPTTQISETIHSAVQVNGPTNEASTAIGAPAINGNVAVANSVSEEDKAKKLLYCSVCKVAVNSLSQLEAHNKGTKHKTILEARSGLGPIKSYPRLVLRSNGELGFQDPNVQERTFHCEICNVKVNSEVQLKQHISSRRHRDGVAGKPNPLLSRHKKLRTASDLTTSLAFHKEFPKTLTTGLFPNPLVAAAMAAASSNPLSLRTSAPLIQAPPLTHHLLRPAPGPIRTSHCPILFAPY
ncbi:zinc finger protein 385A isoform X2 [Protopterus annectens]|uniref:zinc finger protein 385A isoform X2 n=1 Tax=Protopterus annectens TaxID=7888 RepID=UPI001CFC33CA|nr:zinc finger protein 385A isoform X2 [Protopterus annectens]